MNSITLAISSPSRPQAFLLTTFATVQKSALPAPHTLAGLDHLPPAAPDAELERHPVQLQGLVGAVAAHFSFNVQLMVIVFNVRLIVQS